MWAELVCGIVGQVPRDAKNNKSFFHLTVVFRSRRVVLARGQIYVAVFSSSTRQDDLDGRRRIEATTKPNGWTLAVMWSRCGANGFSPNGLRVWKSVLVRVVPGLFSPELVQVKAWACELPSVHKVPLSRWSTSDLVRQVCQTGLVASISGSTLWRWLHQDAIRPWYHRS